MKHLVYIIKELYPTRFFTLKEQYELDEVYNVNVEYILWIEDICSEQFDNFQGLEDYVYKLYFKEEMNNTKVMRGKNE